MYLVHRGACIAASLKLDSSHVPISGFRKARQLPRSDLASGKLDSSHTPIWLQASTRSASTLSLPACFAAFSVALELWQALRSEPMEDVGIVTASFGIASWRVEEGVDGLLLRADPGVYAAKQAGRDRVEAERVLA